MKIGEKTFVSLAYTLKVGGEVVDSATAEKPLEFVSGSGFLLPKFEQQLQGLGQGDKFEFTLTPAEGYGEVMAEAVAELPRSVFMVDGVVEEGLLTVGNQIPMSTAEGQRLLGVVREVADDKVKMDFNHPMAGKTLDFSGEVLEVREATDDDLMQGMAAGGSCGCGGESCGCGGESCGCGGESCGCDDESCGDSCCH